MGQQITATKRIEIKCFKYSRQVYIELTTTFNRTSIISKPFSILCLSIFSFIYSSLFIRNTSYLLEIFDIQLLEYDALSLLFTYLLGIFEEFLKFVFQMFDFIFNTVNPPFLLILRHFIIVSHICLITFSSFLSHVSFIKACQLTVFAFCFQNFPSKIKSTK